MCRQQEWLANAGQILDCRLHDYDFSDRPERSRSLGGVSNQRGMSGRTRKTCSALRSIKTRTVRNADGTTYRTESWTRNPLGQPTQIETRNGANAVLIAYSYTYDGSNRLKSVKDHRGGKMLKK